jgi:hypothetical protein
MRNLFCERLETSVVARFPVSVLSADAVSCDEKREREREVSDERAREREEEF